MAALLLGSTAAAQSSSPQVTEAVKHQPEITVKELQKKSKAPKKEEKLTLADPEAGSKKAMTVAEYDAYRKKQDQEAAKKKQTAKPKPKPQVQFAPPVIKKDPPAGKPEPVKQDEKPKVKFTPPVVVKDTIIPQPVKVKQIAADTVATAALNEKRYLLNEVRVVTAPDGSRKIYDKDGKDITAEIPDLPTAPYPEQ